MDLLEAAQHIDEITESFEENLNFLRDANKAKNPRIIDIEKNLIHNLIAYTRLATKLAIEQTLS